MTKQTDLVNVDFWAGRIAAVIKLAEHYGMTVDITGDDLVVSRRVSEVFSASAEVRWRSEPNAAEAQQPETHPSGIDGPLLYGAAEVETRPAMNITPLAGYALNATEAVSGEGHHG